MQFAHFRQRGANELRNHLNPFPSVLPSFRPSFPWRKAGFIIARYFCFIGPPWRGQTARWNEFPGFVALLSGIWQNANMTKLAILATQSVALSNTLVAPLMAESGAFKSAVHVER